MQGSAEKANNIGYKSYSNCKYLFLKMFRDTTIKYILYLYVFSRNVRITIFTCFFTIKTIGLQSRVYIPRNKQTSSSFLKPLLNKVHVLYNKSLPHMLFYILKFIKKIMRAVRYVPQRNNTLHEFVDNHSTFTFIVISIELAAAVSQSVRAFALHGGRLDVRIPADIPKSLKY